MAWFLYRLTPPRPDFAMTMSPDEQAAMGRHAAYWGEQVDGGSCLIFSPVADPDGVWGLAIVRAETQADADSLGAGDPVVQEGLCTFAMLELLAPSLGA